MTRLKNACARIAALVKREPEPTERREYSPGEMSAEEFLRRHDKGAWEEWRRWERRMRWSFSPW